MKRFWLVLAFVLLAGCSTSIPILGTPTAIAIQKTPQPSPTPKIVSPTPTAVPTLSAEEVRQVVLDVVKNNGGCRLPCVWGLTPGKTSSAGRQEILASFGKVSMPGFRSGFGDKNDEYWGVWGSRNFFINEQDNVEVSISMLYFDGADIVEQIQLSAATAEKWIPVFGNHYYGELFEYYSLSKILNDYGRPSFVLLGVWRKDPIQKAPYDPFSVVVVYSELGFLIEYISPSESMDNYVQGCITDSKFHLWTWDTKKDLSLAEIVAKTPGDEGFTSRSAEFFKPIEEATSLTLDEFYQVFKKPDTTQCLEIPIDLSWP